MKRHWGSLVAFGLVATTALVLTLAGSADGIVIDGYFSDDNGIIFEEDIDAIAQADITRGCNPPTNSRYCPDDPVRRGPMAAFLRRALNLPASNTDHFIDDNNSIFEGDINAIADAGITKGCNPPANNRYCPDDPVQRGPMAAFLRRALNLPTTPTDYFIDDDNSIFQADINAIADANITRGCNPPTNNRYCVNDVVDRGAMAAFLRRGLSLPGVTLSIPMSDHGSLDCDKDDKRCTLIADVVSGRNYRVEEGLFQVLPATEEEMDAFNAGNTNFTLTLDGSSATLTTLPVSNESDFSFRNWRANLSFSSGSHTLVGRWRWDGDLLRTVIVTIRASS